MKKRRIGGKDNITRELILDTTEALMVEIGYGAISTRKVAARIAVTAALVHYYFPTTDDLFIELYRRSAKRHAQLIETALASRQPLHALWTLVEHPEQNALGMEFLALANHRPALRKEIASYIEDSRKMLVESLNALLVGKMDASDAWTPTTLTLFVTAIARLVVLEGSIGISYGHSEILHLANHLIEKFQPSFTV